MYKRPKLTDEEQISRVRKPRDNQIYGIVEMMMGGDKMKVQCDDGKERLVRIPGKLRKRMWVRPGDLILVEPWTVMTDRRGDLAWKYTRTQANWIQRKGFLKNIQYE